MKQSHKISFSQEMKLYTVTSCLEQLLFYYAFSIYKRITSFTLFAVLTAIM